MKKTLLIAFLCSFALPAFAQTFSARYGRRVPRPGQLAIQPQGEGSFQKAARQGNFLQLLNPFAPAQYGSGADMEVFEFGRDPSQKWRDSQERPVAVRLFSIYFW